MRLFFTQSALCEARLDQSSPQMPSTSPFSIASVMSTLPL